MAILLLVVIYAAFIGLGIPDSLFGPAWVVIHKDFDVAVSSAAFVNMTVTSGTIISSLFGARIIRKFGTRWVVIISTFLTVFALLGYAFSPTLWVMVLCAIPMGLGAGCIDSALNNYVALHYKNSHMNFLHCFYGVGVSLSPYLMSMALADNENWRKGYMIAFFIQLGIATLMALSYPLWTRVKKNEGNEEEATEVVSIFKIIRMPMAVLAALVFLFYCGIEGTSGVWSASYLVNVKALDSSTAAKLVTLFYAGLATGRLTAGFFARILKKHELILSGMGFLLSGIVLLFIPSGMVLSAIALFLVGFGCGPIYPNMMSLSPSYYGRAKSQSVIGFEMALAYVGNLTISPFFGVLAEKMNFGIFPYYLSILFVFMICLFITLLVVKKKNNQALD